MVNSHRVVTTGALLWLGSKASDILALSKKPDGTQALTDVYLLTVHTPEHYPGDFEPDKLYIIAYGGPQIQVTGDGTWQATVEYRLVKSTVVESSGSPAAIAADAPLLGDIADYVLTSLALLGRVKPGTSRTYAPDGTAEAQAFETACRLVDATATYHPGHEGLGDNAKHAIAYRLVCTFSLGRLS